MEKKIEKALEILKNGGYWRKQLETQYQGGEKFVTRLHNSDKSIVKGFGFQTWHKMNETHLLGLRSCERSSVWPTEWKISERLETVAA